MGLSPRRAAAACALVMALAATSALAAPPRPRVAKGATSFWDDWSILPLASYAPETSLGLGLAGFHTFRLGDAAPGSSSIAAAFTYTLKDQYVLRLEPELRTRDAILESAVSFQRFPTRYFPPGAHAGDPGEPYDERALIAHAELRARANGPLWVGFRYLLRANDMLETRARGLLEASQPSSLVPWTVLGAGPVLSYDTRDHPLLPRSGVLAELRMQGLVGLQGPPLSGLQLQLDVRGFVSPWRGHVIAMQLGMELSDGTLPFQLLPILGGDYRLRGWFEGRLRARDTLLAQLEYRLPLIWRFGLVGFVSAGEAVDRLADLSPALIRIGGGLGLRFLLNEAQKVSVRVDVAYGDGLAVYVDALEAF